MVVVEQARSDAVTITDLKGMDSSSTSVPNAASKKRSLSLESSLAVMRDLRAVAARGLSVNLAESLLDRVSHAAG